MKHCTKPSGLPWPQVFRIKRKRKNLVRIMKFEKFEAGLCPHFVKFGLKKIVSCELKETRRRAAFTRAFLCVPLSVANWFIFLVLECVGRMRNLCACFVCDMSVSYMVFSLTFGPTNYLGTSLQLMLHYTLSHLPPVSVCLLHAACNVSRRTCMLKDLTVICW